MSPQGYFHALTRKLPVLVLLVLIAIVLLWALVGSNGPEPSGKSSPIPVVKIARPIEPWLVEFPSEALPVWRSTEAPPTLVLLSADPFLMPLPQDLVAAKELFYTADRVEISRRSRFAISNPVLMPTETVRMALRSGILSGLTWVLPLPVDETPLDVEALRTWLLSQSHFTPEEKSTLRVSANGVVGMVEGLPFRATVIGGFQNEPGPMQLHVDLSYVQTLYRNEIKTPLFPLLQATVDPLQRLLLGQEGITISYATANGDVPMTLRFLGPTLRTLFTTPDYLKQGLNEEWRRRRDMLYLKNFQQVDEMVALAKANAAALPEDATAYFDLYYAYKLQKSSALADAALTRACELDPGYAFEYRQLAVESLDLENSAVAVKSLRQALKYDPDNAFHKLDLARVMLLDGEVEAARALIRELQALPWSKVFYPEMPDYLATLATAPPSSLLPPADPQPAKEVPVHPLGHGYN